MSTINNSVQKEINCIYLIASFDLTDSTEYKIKYPHKWIDTFDNIRNFLLGKLPLTNFKFLKQLGDELNHLKRIINDYKKRYPELENETEHLKNYFISKNSNKIISL